MGFTDAVVTVPRLDLKRCGSHDARRLIPDEAIARAMADPLKRSLAWHYAAVEEEYDETREARRHNTKKARSSTISGGGGGDDDEVEEIDEDDEEVVPIAPKAPAAKSRSKPKAKSTRKSKASKQSALPNGRRHAIAPFPEVTPPPPTVPPPLPLASSVPVTESLGLGMDVMTRILEATKHLPEPECANERCRLLEEATRAHFGDEKLNKLGWNLGCPENFDDAVEAVPVQPPVEAEAVEIPATPGKFNWNFAGAEQFSGGQVFDNEFENEDFAFLGSNEYPLPAPGTRPPTLVTTMECETIHVTTWSCTMERECVVLDVFHPVLPVQVPMSQTPAFDAAASLLDLSWGPKQPVVSVVVAAPTPVPAPAPVLPRKVTIKPLGPAPPSPPAVVVDFDVDVDVSSVSSSSSSSSSVAEVTPPRRTYGPRATHSFPTAIAGIVRRVDSTVELKAPQRLRVAVEREDTDADDGLLPVETSNKKKKTTKAVARMQTEAVIDLIDASSPPIRRKAKPSPATSSKKRIDEDNVEDDSPPASSDAMTATATKRKKGMISARELETLSPWHKHPNPEPWVFKGKCKTPVWPGRFV
jgi:hypothetical protein